MANINAENGYSRENPHNRLPANQDNIVVLICFICRLNHCYWVGNNC